MGRKISKYALALLALLVFLFTETPTAWADPEEPDDLTFISVRVTANLTQANDMAIAFHYAIEYDDPPGNPDELADELFTFRLLDTDGTTELGAVSPYTVPTQGYGQGCTALFFDSSDNLTWGEPYILQIAGHPNKWSTPPEYNYELAPTDYWASANQTVSQEYLGDYIINVARRLEDEWDIELLEYGGYGTLLNSYGESYFTVSIRSIQAMCPQIFFVQSVTPEFERRDWDTTQAENYTSRYDDTIIGDWLDSVETKTGADWSLITGGITVMVMLGCIVVSQIAFGRTDAGLLAGLIAFLCSGLMGFVHLAIIAAITLLFGAFIAYKLFFEKA